MANMTFEEKLEAVLMFCDKYESLIDEAPEGSDLWAFGELDKAYDNVVKLGVWIRNAEWEDAKQRLINAMLHIAETWAYDNQDIELVCTDPATGEEVVVEGTPIDVYYAETPYTEEE